MWFNGRMPVSNTGDDGPTPSVPVFIGAEEMNFRQPFLGDYPISQKYGEIVPGVTYQNKPHTGIDYACPEGTKILASADGEVMFASWEPTGYGYCVIIRHTPDRSTLYAQLEGPTVRVGQRVQQGAVIGLSGRTGYATGPHLHFEARRIWNNYQTHFDPMLLPLKNYADFAEKTDVIPVETSHTEEKTSRLKEPADLGELVKVACLDGARVFNPDWSMKYAGFPQGTKLHFTGKTAERPGFPQYTYCEVYEEPRKFWVAVHDGQTQILDNSE